MKYICGIFVAIVSIGVYVFFPQSHSTKLPPVFVTHYTPLIQRKLVLSTKLDAMSLKAEYVEGMFKIIT
jgi:hypothetical protein